MKVNTKRCPNGGLKEEEIINSYGSTNCIRFEGMISARKGHPFVFTPAKVSRKMENSQ